MSSTLHSRIESAVNTAKRWESDKSLFAEVRATIPFRELVPELVCETEARWESYLDSRNAGGGAKEAKEEEEEEDVKGNANNKDAINYKTSCFRDDDAEWEGDDLLLKRLTLYFKQEVMAWCNQPPCSNPDCKGNEDGKQMESMGTRGPETEEERTGDASRVEVYKCKLCGTTTTFPRFNSPRALFKSRRGRCGEFANLFGVYCRALGFDARYVLDFTDHVWTEVWSVRQQRWLHADSCEGIIDRPNMYEQGWGKKLNYAIGATYDSVADVTKRYTRKFYTDDFQARRREYSPDEKTSDMAFLQLGGALRLMNNIGKGRMEELEKRGKAEEKFFGMVQSSGVWDVEYREGRISGSFAWKAARHELGDNKKTTAGGGEDDSARGITQSFLIDSFYPSSNHCGLEIVVRPPRKSSVPSAAPKSHPECITVSGVPCAATLTHGISMVVVDEESGCILQSKAFSRWSSTGVFLDEVPDGRIVALCFIRGEQQEMGTNNGNGGDDSTTNNFRRLGGFDLDLPTNSNERFFLFAGQLNFHPNWAIGICTSDSDQLIKVSLQIKTSLQLKTRLRSEMNVVPAVVSTRLPETVMPLKTQLAASNYQKRAAFNAYVESDVHQSSIIGYTTRHDAPIYLIDSKSFPFRRAGLQTHNAGAKIDASWVTYHLLPDPLVPDDDVTDESKTASNTGDATPRLDIPVANEYFTGLLGNQLLVKNSTMTPSLVDTTAALSNSRIVALYFSAQWCGPCRGFTPLLIEFYTYLQEVAPTHGLKIVFVSSDQDENQFQAYYGKMPFLSLPFSNRSLAQHAKSVFGVRGIPSLVIIDSLSGTIVTSPDESRRDVHQACQRGEEAIERLFRDWLDKVPLETKSMLDILALSCEEAQTSSVTGDGGGAAKNSAKSEDYLIRKKDQGAKSKVVPSTEDFAAIVKEIFSQLVATGMEPNRAAAKAIEQATSKQKVPSRFTKLEVGTISGTSEIKTESDDTVLYQLNDEDMNKVLTVARKYVTNVQKDPSNPRFRNFRLSNKVFDQITSTPGGIELLTNLGFAIYHSDDDFVASIPLAVDLSAMCHVFDNLLKTIVNRT